MTLLGATTLSIKALSVTKLSHHAECHYAQCRFIHCYAECHYADCYADVVMLTVATPLLELLLRLTVTVGGIFNGQNELI